MTLDRSTSSMVAPPGAAPAAADPSPVPELAQRLAVVRDNVAAHARRRRAEGASIERVLSEVRCLVREAESGAGWRDPLDVLMAPVIRWAAEAYHQQTEPEHADAIR